MHDKINVCLLNDSFPPVIDGVANAVVNYGEIISTKNLGKATVVTPEYPGAVDGYPFDVVRYPSLSTRAAGRFSGRALPLRRKDIREAGKGGL